MRNYFCAVLMILAATMFSAASAAALGADGPTFDQLTALHLNHVYNGSFEAAGKSVRHPAAHWGGTMSDDVKVIADAPAAYHGTRFVRVHHIGKGTRTLYGGLDKTVPGKMRFVAHARGRGKVRLNVIIFAKNYRHRPPNERVYKVFNSPWTSVNTTKWQTISAVFDIPAAFQDQGDTVLLSEATVHYRIRVHGNVDIDACEGYSPAAWKKKASRAVPGPGTAHKTGGAGLPMLTIPMLKQAPVIDGVMEKGEWAHAAAVTGFNDDNTQMLADRQTTVFVGYDRTNLYVAYRSASAGRAKGKLTKRDAGFTDQMDAVELWLAPPDKPCVHLLVVPHGPHGVGRIDKQRKRGPWNGRWKAAAKSVDTGQTVGGIHTFNHAIWTVEFAVPFETLGLTGPPAKGSRWRINFNRDYPAGKGKRRTMRDWTTWSPIQGGFSAVKQFGTAVFGGPAVRIVKLGDLSRGDESVSGQVRDNDKKVRVSLRVAPAGDAGKTLAFDSTTLKKTGAGDGPACFALKRELKLNASQPLRATLTAASDDGTMLLRQTLHFRNQPALGLTLVQNPAKHIVWAHIDTQRVAHLAGKYQVKARIYQNNKPTSAQVKATWAGPRAGDVKISTASLKPGEYQLRAKAMDAAGKLLASSAHGFTIPTKPVWLGNTLGISSNVPKPWTPVKWNPAKHTVSITQRVYHLNAEGLPNQITSMGKNILTQPAALVAVVNGKRVSWQGALGKPTHQAPNKIVWPIDVHGRGLRVTGTLTIEFDGFARWNVQVTADQPVRLDALYLNFPMRAHSALYVRARDVAGNRHARFSAALYHPGPPKVISLAGVQFSDSGWAWPKHWMQNIFVGGDLRGLSVMNQTDQYRVGPLRAQILRGDGSRTLRINLVSKSITLKKPLKYDFVWQASPVKPTPKNFKLWTAGFGMSDDPAFVNEVGIVDRAWMLKYDSYPAFRHSKQHFLHRYRKLLKRGVKVVPYSTTDMVTTEVAALKPWLNLWKRYPYFTFHFPIGMAGGVDPQAKSLRDYYAWMTDKIVHQMGMGGLYLDVSNAVGNTNKYQGSGYQPAGGGPRKPTVDVFAQRKLYKRMYRIVKAGGQDKVLFHHTRPMAAVTGFVDVTYQGEGWGPNEKKKEYDRLTPDFFRVQIMRRQMGTPHTWYTFFHYAWRARSAGRVVPLWEILTYCLPHHTLPAAHDSGMWPVWKLFSHWWTNSKFIGYWQKDFPLHIDQKLVLGAVYLKPKQGEALVVVANWNTTPKAVTLTIDPTALGLPAGPVTITRALAHPIHAYSKTEGHDPEPPVHIRGNHVVMHLAGRDLEVLLVRSR